MQIPGARLIAWLAAIALTAYFAFTAVATFPYHATPDFYGFWGVGAARSAAGIDTTPYGDATPYNKALDAIVALSGSQKLQGARQARPALDPTGTPFFYALFAGFPRDYGAAQAFFLALLYFGIFAGVLALARLRGFSIATSAVIAALVGLTFAPFGVDVRVGNVNSIQLGLIALILMVAVSDVRAAKWAMIALGAFIAFKPNVLLLAAALFGWYFVVATRRDFLQAVVGALVLAAASWAIGVAYFDDVNAWRDWLRYARRLAGVDPSIAYESGNQSLAMWLAQRAGTQAPGAFGLAFGVMLATAVFVLAAGPAGGRHMARVTLRRAFSDPLFAASAGILLTFVMSPLLWIHYLVLLLVPMLWLVRGHGLVGTVGALVAYVCVARPTIDLMLSTGGRGLLEAVTLTSWLALIPGLLAFVIRTREIAAENAVQPPQSGAEF